jgi:hypothetical protein
LTPERKRFYLILFASFMAVIGVALWLARHNLRLNRGDRRGAARLAAVVFVLSLVAWALGSDHVPSVAGELYIFWYGVAKALIGAAVVWVLYVALEPFVRRRYPELIVSWSRLLAGDFRDPMVGRDVLVGAAAVLCLTALGHALRVAGRGWGWAATIEGASPDLYLGLREVARWMLGRQLIMSLLHGLAYVFVLCLVGLALRPRWAAGLGLWVLLIVLRMLGGAPDLEGFLTFAVGFGAVVFITAASGCWRW